MFYSFQDSKSINSKTTPVRLSIASFLMTWANSTAHSITPVIATGKWLDLPFSGHTFNTDSDVLANYVGRQTGLPPTRGKVMGEVSHVEIYEMTKV